VPEISLLVQTLPAVVWLGYARRRGVARVGQLGDAGTHHLQPIQVLLGPDHQVVQRPPFPGLPVLHQPHARRGRGEGLDVALHPGVAGDALAKIVTEDRLQIGDRGIVLRAGQELVLLCGAQRRQQRDRESEEPHDDSLSRLLAYSPQFVRSRSSSAW